MAVNMATVEFVVVVVVPDLTSRRVEVAAIGGSVMPVVGTALAGS